jgi:glycosyltransferase involved in cell wall biosynthesis
MRRERQSLVAIAARVDGFARGVRHRFLQSRPTMPAPSPSASFEKVFAGRRILFIHQNFPGQYLHLARQFLAWNCDVKALAIGGKGVPGVDLRRYAVTAKPVLQAADPLADVETKVRRGLACAAAMRKLDAEGFRPDLVLAHPGWGESLFCKDIWPQVPVVAFGEFYYGAEGSDHGFDPEFSAITVESRIRLRLRNTALLHAYQAADMVICPTPWQRSCLPADVQHKVRVVFDGVDTTTVKPDPAATVRLGRVAAPVSRKDSVLTFVNRNLEPYRGFHVFMRALPELMARHPRTRVVVVGENGVSYGSPPRTHKTWREAMLAEVGSRLDMDRLHFVGRVEYADYLRLLQVSTCHVYMTYPFVLSWSCIEALAAGCRVVASDTGPVRDAITHGENGLLFPFFDQRALVDTASGVLENPDPHDAMAQRAIERARAEYDLDTVCKPSQLEALASLL